MKHLTRTAVQSRPDGSFATAASINSRSNVLTQHSAEGFVSLAPPGCLLRNVRAYPVSGGPEPDLFPYQCASELPGRFYLIWATYVFPFSAFLRLSVDPAIRLYYIVRLAEFWLDTCAFCHFFFLPLDA